MPLQFQDGYLGTERLLSVYPEIDYPFANAPTPDITALTLRRRYDVQPGKFVPRIAVRTAGAPDIDATYNAGAPAANASAYLVQETAPRLINSARATFERLYATIPGDQTTPASRTFSRPKLHDLKSGTIFAVSFDEGMTCHLFNARKTVSGISALTASSASRSGTLNRSGTNPVAVGAADISVSARAPATLPSFTINVTGPTAGTSTFFEWSDAVGIQSAFTARGLTNVSVTKTPYRIAISWSGAATLNVVAGSPSVSGGSNSVEITAATVSEAATDTYGSYTQTQTVAETETQTVTETYSIDSSVRTITSTSHGGTAGQQVALYNGDRIVALSRVVAATTNDFTIPLADLSGKDALVTHCVFAPAAYKRIAIEPAVTGASARSIQRFYLPGVSGGIATAADIPKFEVETDPVSWLDHVVAYFASPSAATYFIADSGNVSSYLGPILVKEVTEIQTQDVVIELDPAA